MITLECEDYKNDEENLDEYYLRMFRKKEDENLTWYELTGILNESLNRNLSESSYRKYINRLIKEQDASINNELLENIVKLKSERIKIQDERSQINSLYRRISREDSIKEIALECVKEVSSSLRLEHPRRALEYKESEKVGILELSDLHYGIEINNSWNVYSPYICKDRLEQLRDEIISKCKLNDVKKLVVVNLGDLIAGRIHLQLRINSRIDVITQTMEISELIAQFLNDLSKDFVIDYYDTLDNHSRLEPIKENSLDLESLARITKWYLKERLKNNVNISIYDNEFSDDIITFKIFDFDVVGVHGDKDKPNKVIQNMTLLTHTHYDLVLTAHLHHFQANEDNETLLISNGSMMGTDDYAQNLRLSSKPSQNLIIATENNVCDTLYRIVLH